MEIEAKPTEYAGVLFRSKLEATWARFFDVRSMQARRGGGVTIEPHEDETKIVVPYEQTVYARMLYIEAQHVRARYRKHNGTLTTQSSGPNANDARKRESDARRDALAQRALELLSIGDLTSGIMRNRLMVSENRMRNAMGYLRKQGRADFVRKGTITIWRKLEAK